MRTAAAFNGVAMNVIGIGSSVVRTTMRPAVRVVSVTTRAGLSLERQTFGRVVESQELERLAGSAADSAAFQRAFSRALESDAAKQLVDAFFESSLFEELIIRLLDSRALWLLVEEVADSPAVTAAITGQGLGFADQVAQEVRNRSHRTDTWLEQAARRLSRGHATGAPSQENGPGSGGGS